MVRFLRTPEYTELISGDPTWVTESIGGMGIDGRTLVTKKSVRVLNTLYTLGPSQEPNLTVLWSTRHPQVFKDFCSKVSIETSSIQYENVDLMREYWGDDYGIACCVSAMRIGKQMQFFGARVNVAKTLLYSINGGVDEKSGAQVGPKFEPITSEYLDYDEVMSKFDLFTDWLAKLYVNTLNVIHYMHDKYSYEALEMALHDRDVFRTMACGMAGLSVCVDSLSAIKYAKVKTIRKAGLSVCVDSLSAIKYAKVKTIRNEEGIAVDFEVEGDYPKYGNNDDRADEIAIFIVKDVMEKIKKNKTYRNSYPTQSILTITSNVVYGKKTGNTPDGRRAGEPFAPGANPMHGRDNSGALASLASVAKLPYEYMEKIKKNKTYRNSYPTQSILTITSNVVYGKKTGNTPDGRRAGEPFAPGANPMHGRDNSGALASLASVAKIPYEYSQDGISNTFSIVPKSLGKDMDERVTNLSAMLDGYLSNTFSIVPKSLGKDMDERVTNLSAMLDGYFAQKAHHLNVNVFDRATLEDAMEHPEKYPQLTVRVSGYAVNFIKLTREQQLDVINRTFHNKCYGTPRKIPTVNS